MLVLLHRINSQHNSKVVDEIIGVIGCDKFPEDMIRSMILFSLSVYDTNDTFSLQGDVGHIEKHSWRRQSICLLQLRDENRRDLGSSE